MILPLTQGGAPSPLGVSMRNAAQLAVDEFAASITLMVKDDRSTPDGAAQAAQAAIGDGAELILGPVYAADVREVALAKSAGRPVIGFSTDTDVAQPGIYLLSFLIESYVDRITDFADPAARRLLRRWCRRTTTATSPWRPSRKPRRGQHPGRDDRPLLARQPVAAAPEVSRPPTPIDALRSSRPGGRDAGRGRRTRRQRHPHTDPGNPAVERPAGAPAAGDARRLVRSARQCGLHRACAALQGEVRHRAPRAWRRSPTTR